MRRFVFTVLALLLSSAASLNIDIPEDSTIEPFIFEDIINATIEELRPLIPDPFLIDNLGFTFPADSPLVGTASISNLKLSGLQGFQMQYLNFAIIGMRFNFTLVLPEIDFYTDFFSNVTIPEVLALYGDGNASVHIENAVIEGSTQMNLTGGISLENLRVALHVNNVTFVLHGVLDDEDVSSLISDILNDLVAKFIDEHEDSISGIISPIIQDIINAILNIITHITTAPPLDLVTAGLD